MNAEMDSLFSLSQNEPKELDMELIQKMSAYGRQAKWNFPVGLPECVNLKALAESVIANSGLYSTRKKDRWFSRLAKHPEIADRWYRSLPFPEDSADKLGLKQKLVLSALMMNGDRINHLKTQVSKHILKGIPEVFLLNRYAKKIQDTPIFESIDQLTDREVDRDDGTSEKHPMEMLAFVRCEALHNISSLFVVRTIISDLLARAYEDVLADNERGKDAAAAIFALGSLTECRWFLDYVYQKSPEIFNKHYSSLSFFNPERLIAKEHATGEKPTQEEIMQGYEPIDLDLTSDQFSRLMSLHSEALRLPLLEMRISELAENMSFDVEEPLAALDNLDNLLDDTASCETHLRTVRREIQDLVIHRLPLYMTDHIDRLVQVIDRFFAVFDKFEKPDLEEMRETVKAFCDDLHNAKSPKVAGLLAGVMQVDQLVDSAEMNVGEILSEHEALTEEIRSLSQEPGKNRERIQAALAEMSELDDAVEQSLDHINQSITALKNTMEMAHFRIMEVHEEDSGSSQPDPSHDLEDAYERDEDYEELLEISESENRKLNKELLEVKAQNENLIGALSTQRESEASEGMSGSLRELVLKKFVQQERLSVEECLVLTKALFPETVILPSAWSSAAEYTHFEYTEKLSDCLMTLAGRYVELIANGTPDSEARKLFPNKMFAANESETIASGSLRKDREFLYNGEHHYFDKHLRIGVATDVRKTIRVHFDVIDNKLVIAFCGEHKRV